METVRLFVQAAERVILVVDPARRRFGSDRIVVQSAVRLVGIEILDRPLIPEDVAIVVIRMFEDTTVYNFSFKL